MESSPPGSVPPGSSPPLVALPTQAEPLLRLAAHLPPRAQPDRFSFVIRAVASSRMGKLAMALMKELWSDPKRLKRILDAIFKPPPQPQPQGPLALELLSGERADLMELLRVVLTILGASVLLSLVCSGVQDDQEDALRHGRLPGFVRHGLGQVVGLPPLSVRRPLRSLRPMALVRARDAEMTGLVQDDAQGRGRVGAPVNLAAPAENVLSDFKEFLPRLLRTKEQGISCDCKEIVPGLLRSKDKDGLMKTEQGISIPSVGTENQSMVQMIDPAEMDYITVDSKLQSYAGKKEEATGSYLQKTISGNMANDPVSVKKAMQLQECMRALRNSKGYHKETPETATEKITDPSKIKPGDKSISTLLCHISEQQ